jgi:uncharacterized membrane protein
MQPQRDPTVWTRSDAGAERAPRAIIALAFPAPQRAKDALDAAMMLQDRGLLAVHDAVLVFRPTDARARVRETRDPSPTVAAVPGSLLGALLGVLLAGPLGLVIGGAVGAGSGALAARLIDIGIPDDVVVQLRELTAPGDTVLALLVSDVHGVAVIEELRRFQGARIVYATLPEAALELVRRTLIPEHRAQA